MQPEGNNAEHIFDRKSYPYTPFIPSSYNTMSNIPYYYDTPYDPSFLRVQEIWNKSDECMDTMESKPDHNQSIKKDIDSLLDTSGQYSPIKHTSLNPHNIKPYKPHFDAFRSTASQISEGSYLECSKDPNGSRKLQQQIESSTKEQYKEILKVLIPFTIDLVVDPYGNYVVQKLIECGDQECYQLLIQAIKTHVLALSINQYACRVIQLLLDVVPLDGKIQIFYEVSVQVPKMIENTNANHVIQKFIEKIPEEHISPIVKYFTSNAEAMCMHVFGCRLVQRLLESSNEAMMKPILVCIMKNFDRLVKDSYGNYVVQYILERSSKYGKERQEATKFMIVKIEDYCLEKYASNVVEKCLKNATAEELELLIKGICSNG